MNELEIKCSVCGEPMKNLGNVSGIVLTSYPEQWDDVYVCDKDNMKQVVRKRGQMPPNYGYLKDYKTQ